MTNLEQKKIEVELLRVTAAKEELKLRILEREDEIARINEQIKIQEAREAELKERLGARSN